MFFGCTNLIVGYDKNLVLTNINLCFEKGQITAITGLNGSGKTTIVKTLTGSLKAYDGSVIINDNNLNNLKPKQRAKLISYLPQKHVAPPDINVNTLVSYGRYPYKEDKDNDEKIIDEVLNTLNISNLKNRTLASLSGGELQKAWLAMALAQKPEILILDEPTTFLDIASQISLLETLKDLNKKTGLTIIMVLHDLNMACRYASNIIVLGNNSIMAQGSPIQIMTQHNLQNYFNINATIKIDNNTPYFLPQEKL